MPQRQVRFELDHVFLAASKGAPEADQIVAAGFAEGAPNTHPGQGTACRRIFFDNAYLELAWIEDVSEASSPVVVGTGLAHRLGGEPDVSRMGVCLRGPDTGGSPVGTWPYRAPYLPEGVSIPIADNSSRLHEPLIFFLPRAMARGQVNHVHANGARLVTDVSITLPAPLDMSPELEWLAGSGCVRVDSGSRQALRLELDRGVQGRSLVVDTPTPLELKW